LPILEGIKAEIEKIKLALEPLDLTMIGSSLLIIYEADWERAAEGFEFISRHASDDEDEDEDEEEPDGSSRLTKQGPPYRVRLIDFAHTRFIPGHGPDQGVLKGINSLLTILDGIIGDISEEKS
jgi:1D-myo-inositol-tetrakisphosphate 5-kinase/inositol-polyphosphate multikinase